MATTFCTLEEGEMSHQSTEPITGEVDSDSEAESIVKSVQA